MKFRTETDSLGSLEVPMDSYYGIQTVRALNNFQISGITITKMPELIRALASVKKSSALANKQTGAIDYKKADAIILACDEILSGSLHDEFVIDVMQGGAGTSTNMNVNEVIANRANEILGRKRGEYSPVHPNDHVNCSQSTNDSYATSVRLSVYWLNEKLILALSKLETVFREKSMLFNKVPKLGRTQLQDAVPMTVGFELLAYANTILEDIERAKEIVNLFTEVNLGGTAIGSSIGASEEYCKTVVNHLCDVTGLKLKRGADLFEASWDMGAFVLYSSMLKRIAVKLSKICNDFRLLSSGPFGGIGEYILPAQQPGSSIMPGKVNPVIPEVVNQVCYKAFGSDTVVTFAAEAGQLQLNAMEPVIIWSISETAYMLIAAINTLIKNCLTDLDINEPQAKHLLNKSFVLATKLVPVVGYEQSVSLAKSAISSGLSFKAYIMKHHQELSVHLN